MALDELACPSRVLAQTYRDFELIIVDDGTTNSSKEMVAPHQSDEIIRYIYQNNRVFSAAANREIKDGSDSLIGFICQDLQVKYLSEHKDVDLVHSNYCFFGSEERIINVREVKIPNASAKKEVARVFEKP